jgi:hypothetical protein
MNTVPPRATIVIAKMIHGITITTRWPVSEPVNGSRRQSGPVFFLSSPGWSGTPGTGSSKLGISSSSSEEGSSA